MTAPERRIYVDATMASVHLLWTYNVMITSVTIRQWGARGSVTRQPRGQYRYDLQEVIDYARSKGLLEDR